MITYKQKQPSSYQLGCFCFHPFPTLFFSLLLRKQVIFALFYLQLFRKINLPTWKEVGRFIF